MARRATTTVVVTKTTTVTYVGRGKRAKDDDEDDEKKEKPNKQPAKSSCEQCQADTKKTGQCKRVATFGQFCWQHKEGKDERDDEGEAWEPHTPEPLNEHTGGTQDMANWHL